MWSAHFNVNWTFKVALYLSVSDVNTSLHLKDKAFLCCNPRRHLHRQSERSSPLELPPGVFPYRPLAHIALRGFHSKTRDRRKKMRRKGKCPQTRWRTARLRLWSWNTLNSFYLFNLWARATSSASLGTFLRSIIFNCPSPFVAFELLHCKCISANNQHLPDISKPHLFLILGHDKKQQKTVISLPKKKFSST